MAFLAIPVSRQASPAGFPILTSILSTQNIQVFEKAAALVSTFFAMASIVTGVHHLWKHRPKSDADPVESVRQPPLQLHIPHRFSSRLAQDNYIKYVTRDSWRITIIASFLSSPLVFLLWSIAIFSVALLHFLAKVFENAALIILTCVAAGLIVAIFCVRLVFYRIWDTPLGFRAWFHSVFPSINRWPGFKHPGRRASLPVWQCS